MSSLREEDDLKSWKQSKVLSTSIQDDNYRREVDAAKKRAAAQNVDYPTFAAMVSAAHLQPVERKTMGAPRFESGKTVPAWSFSSSGDFLRREHQSEQRKPGSFSSKDAVLQSLASIRNLHLKEDLKQKQPSAAAPPAVRSNRMTLDIFQKKWSSLSLEPPAKRVEFLTGSSFRDVFKVEMPPGVVMSILETLHDVVALKHGSAVSEATVEVMSSISRCPRFQISLKLMELKCGGLLDRLFEALESSAIGKEDLCSRIKELQALFCRKNS